LRGVALPVVVLKEQRAAAVAQLQSGVSQHVTQTRLAERWSDAAHGYLLWLGSGDDESANHYPVAGFNPQSRRDIEHLSWRGRRGTCWTGRWCRRRRWGGCRRLSWCRRCRRSGRRGGRRAGRRRWLHLQGADVDAPVKDASITGAALIVQRRRSEVRIARVYGRAARQQRVGKSEAPIVLQRAEHGIRIDLVAGRGQEAAAAIAAEVVATRGDRASVIMDVRARVAGVQDCIPDLGRAAAAVDDGAAPHTGPVAANRAIANHPGSVVSDATAIVSGVIAADRAIGDRNRAAALDASAEARVTATRGVTADRAIGDLQRAATLDTAARDTSLVTPASYIVANRAVDDDNRAVAINTSAKKESPVARYYAVADRHRPSEDTAAGSRWKAGQIARRVTADTAIYDCHRSSVIDATAKGRIVAEITRYGAVIDGQRCLVINNPAVVAAAYGDAFDCNSVAGHYMKNGDVRWLLRKSFRHREQIWAGTVDENVLINYQLDARERDGVSAKRRIEVNRVAVVRVCERLAERARSAVSRAGDGECGCANAAGTGQRRAKSSKQLQPAESGQEAEEQADR